MEGSVSIHAPARGATPPRVSAIEGGIVSIHAPARGATICATVPSRTHGTFQSTHPHGVRRLEQEDYQIGQRFQSTHPHGVRLDKASIIPFHNPSFNPRTRTGCDLQHLGPACRPSRFNPRTRTGCDSNTSSWLLVMRGFQSTHPHGVRPHRVERWVGGPGFNPRTRTGCDSKHFKTFGNACFRRYFREPPTFT